MIRTLLFTLSLIAAAGGALSNASAQDAQPAPDATGVDALVQKVSIITRTPTLTAVPENDPLPVSLSLVEVPGASPDLTKGVTAKAYTRYVTVDGKKVGQVVLTAVEKDGKSEALSSGDFSAQFDLSKPELDPSATIEVKGDGGALIAALKKLAEPQVAQTAPEAAPAKQTEVGATQNQTGSNAGQNTDAAAYKTPDALPVAQSATPVVKVTTEGCSIRVDTDQGYAIQQNRVETTESGSVSTTACEDGDQRFPLQRSYLSCADKIDLQAKTATAQFALYYTDGGGTRNDVGECAPDADQVFAIVEKRSSCTVYLDYGTNQAVPQAALVYVNANNAEVQVRGCEASTAVAAVPLEETTDGCSIRHDVAGGKSYQQGRTIYTLDGVTWQAGGCADNGTEYPHTKVYETAAGDKVCAPIVDVAGGTATLQYKLGITVAGLEQYISECKPDTSSLAVTATTSGCNDPTTWTHDLDAGVSYGRERYFYTYNGKTTYVTECQTSAASYAHQVETTGWQNHDDQLFAYALSTLYITPPTGRYNVKTSEVLAGATQAPYVYAGETTAASGEITYEGCSRFEGRNTVHAYTRPDGSTYGQVIGATTALGPTDACNTVNDLVWSRTSNGGGDYSCTYFGPDSCGDGGCVQGTQFYGSASYYWADYTGGHKRIREDGVTVIDTNATKRYTLAASSSCQAGTVGNPGAGPATLSGSTVNTWIVELGWN